MSAARSRASRIQGLAPIAAKNAHTLILGSMPSVASLEAGEYYGHPRNAFWDVVACLGIPRSLAYRSRCARLRHLGFALWDVLAECERAGSLDQAIRSPRVNDLAAFVQTHPRLERIWLNGKAAERFFRREIRLPEERAIELRVFPSTSPAHTDKRKFEHWRQALHAAANDSLGQDPADRIARRFG